MSKFRCVCGEILSTSGEIPNPTEWLAIADVQFDVYAGEIASEELYSTFTHVLVCPRSGHLWVFKDGFDSEPSGYEPVLTRAADEAELP